MRVRPALLLLLPLAAFVPASAADEAATEYVSGLTAGAVREEDPEGGPDLEGARIAFTAFSEGPRWRFAGSWYLEWKESRLQQVLEGGVEIAVPYVERGRFGFGPRARLALQDRAEPPDRGLDGVIGLGFELGVWVADRVQLAAFADRSVGFDSGTRNTYTATVRVMLWND